jgi:hypothetical protein
MVLKLTVDFKEETSQVRGEGNGRLTVMKETPKK